MRHYWFLDLYRYRQITNDYLPIIVQQMSKSLIHRGSDDDGSLVDGEVGIALGHRQLSIVDLSFHQKDINRVSPRIQH